jgi:hypothetical protein
MADFYKRPGKLKVRFNSGELIDEKVKYFNISFSSLRTFAPSEPDCNDKLLLLAGLVTALVPVIPGTAEQVFMDSSHELDLF